jgi:hypothetical protein
VDVQTVIALADDEVAGGVVASATGWLLPLAPVPISGIDGRCSAGEHRCEALLERGTGKRTDDSVDLVPVVDHDQERDRLGAEARSECGLASTSTLTTLSCPACRPARSSSTGEIIRQGPHHAAQKSTTTGTEALVSAANVSVSASTNHGSSDLYLGQRGNPEAIGPTRLCASQLGQTMMAMLRG